MPEKNLKELFTETLQDISYAEKQILCASQNGPRGASTGAEEGV